MNRSGSAKAEPSDGGGPKKNGRSPKRPPVNFKKRMNTLRSGAGVTEQGEEQSDIGAVHGPVPVEIGG